VREKAIELRYEDTDYLIVPHQAILALIRETPEDRSEITDEDLDELLD
jgi:hypothetical protein